MPEQTLPEVDFGGATHPGTSRAINEDQWLASPPLFAVADGMGGHQAGDVASAIVVERLRELAEAGDVGVAAVEACLARCHADIASAIDHPELTPGSTVVIAALVAEQGAAYWQIASLGDSRVYALRQGRLEQWSKDHSRVQELIDAGSLAKSAARQHPERHVITRALGAVPDAIADFALIPVEELDVVLLCSDGVTSELDDSAIERHLAEPQPAEALALRIVEAAVAAGGRDNATALVVKLQRDDSRALDAMSDTLPGRPM